MESTIPAAHAAPEAATGQSEELVATSHTAEEMIQMLSNPVDSQPGDDEIQVEVEVSRLFQNSFFSFNFLYLLAKQSAYQDETAKVVQTMLFISGVNTLLQSLFGTRLPLVIGGSYAYLIPITSIIQFNSSSVLQDPELRFMHTMRGIQGALIVTSGFQIIMGFFGLWRNLVRLLSPLFVAPLVTLTGLGLYHLGFPLIAECVEVGIPQLIFMVVITQYLPTYLKLKRPIYDRFAMLFSIAIIWFYAAILTWSDAYKNAKEATCRTDCQFQ
ncbi:PREDICTED: nucleobase-ascorbate transporter 7-like [Nicotiana attenuata]|uniref:nucleobase-ascorbate transporter 7-like n=1 Tax=Nicotiana attenuata TaxID=49451 RepID=UPI000904EBAA|nr:PREDICTED: nucleobase-ascorbate transporter 7-like [Nicotiana attenuata]